ncbi:Ran-interacting protein Mog1, putative [Talaromyces islandicus]|uniref:Ran-interacting protein Mog1, putative n=1 Tax=Talaromyces islandicus TaxID=28573 RepID=A0A0U1LY90_TALIS|nr:Ran-interacting protein Mog1, putative [Talaromyces islandicus]
MTTQFQERPLFGGAITGTIPQGWLDASDLRQVPDHQEIFLSATTLSNLIVEINEYVSAQEAPPAAAGPGSGTDEENKGVSAALYHLQDLCDEDDTMAIVSAPRRVQLDRLIASSSAAGVTISISAYAGVVKYTTPKRQRGPHQHQQHIAANSNNNSIGDATASSSAAATPKNSVHSCHFLLVRLPEKQTDLLVFVNVPHDEFDAQGDSGALAREEAVASELVRKFVETIDVVDWNLFG